VSHEEGNLVLGEHLKEERKMFVFSNTFELLHQRLIAELNQYEILPALQVLELTAPHLSRRLFDLERASVDDYIMTTVLRNQLVTMLDFKTTSKVFGLVFGEQVNKKVSIFHDSFNPQAAVALNKVFASVLMTCKDS